MGGASAGDVSVVGAATGGESVVEVAGRVAGGGDLVDEVVFPTISTSV